MRPLTLKALATAILGAAAELKRRVYTSITELSDSELRLEEIINSFILPMSSDDSPLRFSDPDLSPVRDAQDSTASL